MKRSSVSESGTVGHSRKGEPQLGVWEETEGYQQV